MSERGQWTVKHHLANARAKVGAETTTQLVWILAPRLPEPKRHEEPHFDWVQSSSLAPSHRRARDDDAGHRVSRGPE